MDAVAMASEAPRQLPRERSSLARVTRGQHVGDETTLPPGVGEVLGGVGEAREDGDLSLPAWSAHAHPGASARLLDHVRASDVAHLGTVEAGTTPENEEGTEVETGLRVAKRFHLGHRHVERPVLERGQLGCFERPCAPGGGWPP